MDFDGNISSRNMTAIPAVFSNEYKSPLLCVHADIHDLRNPFIFSNHDLLSLRP